MRKLRCAIEQIAGYYPRLFLEPHIVACGAILGTYGASPASLAVECENVRSRWLREDTGFTLSVSWREETAGKAERLRRTVQPRPLVEMASIALAMIVAHRVLHLKQLDVTGYGERTDYYSRTGNRFLEVSGTEQGGELGRRHREKVAQATANPLGLGAYVVVCSFGTGGHRIRVSGHEPPEREHDQG